MQTCRGCSVEKDWEKFPKNKTYKSGRATLCKACQAAKAHIWRDPVKTAASKFKISEEYARELKAWSTCFICGTESSPQKSLCIDHNHTTGVVRGVLCDYCNKGLGLFRDNPKFLKTAINYLDTYD